MTGVQIPDGASPTKRFPDSADISVDVHVDHDGNAAVATVTERRDLRLEDLFQDGELRLWEDAAGWSGLLREETDDGPVYFSVNTRHGEDSWVGKTRIGETAVRLAIQHHIEDRTAGGRGRFVRRCSPP